MGIGRYRANGTDRLFWFFKMAMAVRFYRNLISQLIAEAATDYRKRRVV